MMKVNKDLSFCFKGERNYVHGTDIFDKIIGEVYDMTGCTDFKDIDMIIHQVSHKNLTMKLGERENVNYKPNVAFNLLVGDERLNIELFESGKDINCRYGYPEEEIIGKANYNKAEQSIGLNHFQKFSFIEQVVALNKSLLNKLFPDADGKWYFVRIRLRSWKYDINKDTVFDFNLKLKKNLRFKITDTIIFIGDKEVGHIYFSLVKNQK